MFFEDEEDESQCIVCGCTDMAACPDGCAWAVVDRACGVGVCTACDTPEAREAFEQAGADPEAEGPADA
jgi:hypothetical protein